MKYTLRALLSVGLLAGVYVLALGVLAALGLALYELVAHGLTGYALVKLSLFTLVVAVAVISALVRRSPSEQPEGQSLLEAKQPMIWSEARRIADLARTRAPDEIRLIPAVNAAVSESSGWLGLRPGTRRLYVGVPLLVGLSSDQLRSVLAHEFGHYSGRHTALAGVTYRGRESLSQLIRRLGPRSLVGRLFVQYSRLYLAVSSGVNRRQELEADQLSAELVGPRTAAFTLRQLRPLDAAWQEFLQTYAVLGNDADMRPAELFEGFAWFWSSPTRQRRLAPLRDAPEEQVPSPYDSHPPTPQRTAVLDARPDPGVADESGPALELLTDYRRTLVAFEDFLFEGRTAEPTPFEELAHQEASQNATYNAAALLRNLRAVGLQDDLEGVVSELRSGRATALSRPHLQDADPATLREASGQLVGDLVAATMVHEGRARFQLNWDGPWTLHDPSGRPLDPWTPAKAAAEDHLRVDQLVDWLVDHDVRSNWVPEVDAPEPGAARPPEPGVHAVAVCLHRGVLVRILFVTHLGVAVKKLGLVEGLGLGVRHGSTDAYVSALRHCVRLSVEELEADTHTRIIRWSDLRGVVVTTRRDKVRTIHVAGVGSALARFRIAHGQIAGDVATAVSLFAGDRIAVR